MTDLIGKNALQDFTALQNVHFTTEQENTCLHSYVKF